MFICFFVVFFRSPELKAHRVAYRMEVEPSLTVRLQPCILAFTLSYTNISATSQPIAIKFYLKHHLGGGNVAFGFGLGQIRTLFSMATDSFHRLTMGKP